MKIFRIVALAAILFPVAANAGLIIDNGPISPSKPTWNDTDSDTVTSFTIYDDFTLTGDTTITSIAFGIFMMDIGNYTQTYVSIFDGIGITANAVIPEFTATGTLTSNGLVTTNSLVPYGFDVSLAGLNLNLIAGTYFLGIRTDTTSTNLASIGSGFGGPDTIGPGLFQAYGTSPAAGGYTQLGDDFAFKLYGDAAPTVPAEIPTPTTISLIGLALTALGFTRRKDRIFS